MARSLIAQTWEIDPEAFSMRQLVGVAWRRVWVIAWITIFGITAALAYSSSMGVSETSTVTVRLKFLDRHGSAYPSGRAFSPTDIIGPDVLGRVVRTMQLDQRGIRVPTLQQVLTVEPLFREERNERNQLIRVPLNQFTVRMGSIPALAAETKRQLLTEIIDQYRRVTIEDFFTDLVIPDPVKGAGAFRKLERPFVVYAADTLRQMDYPAIVEELGDYLGTLVASATVLEANRDFRAGNGRSFSDAKRTLELIRDTEFTDLAALVRTFQLTKDLSQLVLRYQNRISELELKQTVAVQESTLIRVLLSDAHTLRDVRFGSDVRQNSGQGATSESPIPADLYRRLYTENYYSELVARALTSGSEAMESGAKLRFYRDEVDRLKRDTVEVSVKQAVMVETDARLSALLRELGAAAAELNDMRLAFLLDRSKEEISYINLPQSTTAGVSTRRQAVVGLAGIAGLMIGVLGVFLWYFWESTSPAQAKSVA